MLLINFYIYIFKEDFLFYAMVSNQFLKIAIIAGASYALKYMEEHPKATEAEAMSYVTENLARIIQGLDEEE